MLISDWSSDVCCSDLLAQAMAAGIEGHRPILGAMRIDGDTGLNVGSRRIAVGVARAAEADVLMVSELRPCRARRLPMVLVADLLEVATEERRKDVKPAPGGPIRSEECTSELPSLLRISSAVIC